MFEHLPMWLWLVLGLVVLLFLFWLFRKIQQFFTQAFRPFKKGKRYWCKVIAVSDGDTITCRRINLRGSVTKIRLAYIDAPESSQAFGPETQQMVMNLVYKKLVRIKVIDTDRYGRHVAEVHRRRRMINEELVKRGGAWVYSDYIKDKKYAERLQKIQMQAKKDKRGLWKNGKAVNPSTYRKAN